MSQKQTERVSGKESFRRSGLLIASTTFVAAGIAFLVNLLMARTLGPQSRGDVAFLLQISYFVAPLATLGRERVILRGNEAILPTATGGYVLAIALIMSLLLIPALGTMAPLVGAISLSGAMLSLYRANAVARSKTRAYVTLFACQQGTLMLGVILLTRLNVQDWRAWAACYAPTACLYIFLELRSLARRERISASRESISLMPGVLAALTVTRLDRLLLPVLGSSYQLGLYVTVATATEPVFWVSQLLADRRSAAARRKMTGASKEALLFALASACIGVALWFLIVPLFGPAFDQAKILILPLAIAGFALAIYRQAIAKLLSGSVPTLSTRAEVFTAIVAIVLYSVAIPMYGAIGAAYASACVYGIGFLYAKTLTTKHG